MCRNSTSINFIIPYGKWFEVDKYSVSLFSKYDYLNKVGISFELSSIIIWVKFLLLWLQFVDHSWTWVQIRLRFTQISVLITVSKELTFYSNWFILNYVSNFLFVTCLLLIKKQSCRFWQFGIRSTTESVKGTTNQPGYLHG